MQNSKRRMFAFFLIVLGFLAIACALTYWISQPWFYKLNYRKECIQVVPANTPVPFHLNETFRKCARDNAKIFFDRDYVEAKDLAKTFLTLLSAMLVTSITFSEKIVDVHKASKLPLGAMIVCWLFLLCAIGLTGGRSCVDGKRCRYSNISAGPRSPTHC